MSTPEIKRLRLTVVSLLMLVLLVALAAMGAVTRSTNLSAALERCRTVELTCVAQVDGACTLYTPTETTP